MTIPENIKIYIACGRTDMRKQIDGLAQLVQDYFQLDVYERAIFLFCGRKCDRIKALYWDGDGFVLLYKRLEGQGRYRWPRTPEEMKQLTQQQYRWLMEGLEIEQKTKIQPARKGRIS